MDAESVNKFSIDSELTHQAQKNKSNATAERMVEAKLVKFTKQNLATIRLYSFLDIYTIIKK